MIAKQLQEIINGGEGLTVEFKECRSRVNRDVYESICAFLNRNGGHIILGVRDDGGISGIDPVALPEIKIDLVTTLNNLQKLIRLYMYYRKPLLLKGTSCFIYLFRKALKFIAVSVKY